MVLLRRIKLEFWIKVAEPTAILYDNRYAFYSAFLKVIQSAEPRLAEEIHAGHLPRPFLFSNLIFNRGNPAKSNAAHMYITSPYGRVFSSLLRGLSSVNALNLHQTSFIIKNLSVQDIEVSSNKFTFLSPLLLRDKSGQALSSFNKELFEDKIKDGLLRVGKKLGLEGEPAVHIIGNSMKRKLYNIKGTFWRAYVPANGEALEIDGPDEWRALALYYGIGDKTQMGFGMLGVAKEC